MALFQTAQRKKAKLRLAIEGPSGSGKTHSALLLAAGLVPNGKIFLIDTEHSSASLEVGKLNIPVFSHATLEPPYTAARYKQYIDAAGKEGANLIIVDSLSHAWSGKGGLLDKHDKVTASRRDKNSWAAWRDVTPDHNALIDAILQSPCHIICTMRTKTAWEVIENEKGKKAPVKIGLKPEQREGMDYEFTVVLDLSLEKHIATASKDRTSLFDGKYAVPSVKVGEKLAEWLSQGVEPTPAEPIPPSADQTDQVNRFIKLINSDKTEADLNKRYKNNVPFIESLDANSNKKVITAFSARKKVILAQKATIPPPATPDPVATLPVPQDKEEIPPPEEDDLPPVFDETPDPEKKSETRKKAIADSKAFLDSAKEEELPTFMSSLKRTLDKMPLDDQAEIRSYYDSLVKK